MLVARDDFYHRVEEFLRVEIFNFLLKNRRDACGNFFRVESAKQFGQNFAHESFSLRPPVILLEVVNQKLRGVFIANSLHNIFCVQKVSADELYNRVHDSRTIAPP